MESLSASAAGADPEYRFRARMIGGESVFRLTPEALEFESGRRASRVRYADVARLRLSYRPSNLAARRFLAEIWPRQGAKLSIASVSAKGPFSFENLDEEYRAFIMELCRRIEAARPGLLVETGMPWWRWWPAAIFAAIVLAATAWLAVRGVMGQGKMLAVIMVVFAALFIWQIGMMLLRNRPRRCSVDTIPARVLP